jgi:hypothetical protein
MKVFLHRVIDWQKVYFLAELLTMEKSQHEEFTLDFFKVQSFHTKKHALHRFKA